MKVLYQMFADGATYQEIATALGMTRQRVQQLCRPSIQLVDMLKRRANNKCERCGIEPRNPHIHHVERNGLPLPNSAESLKKLLYLCPSCHIKQHLSQPRGRKNWPQREWDFSYLADGELPKLDCVICSHIWIPRQENLPKVCPVCKSVKWNEKRAA